MNPLEERENLLVRLALTKAASDRAAFLDHECGGDPALRFRVEARMALAEQGELPNTQASTADDPAAPDIPVTPGDVPGQNIGPYKLLEKIGEGGFGVVYVADQTKPVRRRVALKVIKPGMDTKAVVARFEAERQALAMMDHPNIARVLDAGATENGRPYFVMDLVRGIRITDYADQNRLTTKDRLELFIKVCHALQHAHQKGIIHRDIKPSNILVTSHDGVPVPKVIDFGIAKATEGRLTDVTIYTQLHQFIGTPAYMSPEQAGMSGLEIDTRSDLYSLGVVLYELLTGRPPFDSKDLLSKGIDAMRKAIRENEAAHPSTKVATLQREELTATAKHRSVDPGQLIHQLKGDLDWIVMKCLEKDRTHRYETASGLATDIQRHLDNQPVSARPPSRAYRLQKVFRRNRFAVAASLGILATLLLGVLVGTWQAARAPRSNPAYNKSASKIDTARATGPVANPARITSLAVKPLDDFSGDTNNAYLADGMTEALCAALGSVSALRVPGRSSVMRYKGTSKAIQEMAGELNVEAIVEGSIQRSMNKILVTVQLIEAATDRHLWATNYQRDLSDFFVVQSEVARAVAHAVQARLTPEDHNRLSLPRPASSEVIEACLVGMHHFSKLSDAGFTNALKYFQRAIELDPTYAPGYAGAALTYANGAACWLWPSVEAMPRARTLAQKAIDLEPTLAEGYMARGTIRQRFDWDWNGAEQDFQQAIALKPHSSEPLHLYALSLSSRGRHNEAKMALTRALELDPLSPTAHTFLGWTYLHMAEMERAMACITRAVELDRSHFLARYWHGWMLALTGKQQESIAEFRALLKSDPDSVMARMGLGSILAEAGQRSEALQVLADSDELATRRYVTQYVYALIYFGLGDYKAAVDRLERAYKERDPLMASLKVDLGGSELKNDARFRKILAKVENGGLEE